MNGIWHHLRLSLRLHFRNRMALLYGYLFPTIFLIAFWVLYRHERVPLVRHMGELLTVTILGGACFGLATTLVSERERGVWRRFKLAPVPAGALVIGTLAARYVLLVTAGLLQIAIALLLGMPLPLHPIDLVVAFTVASFAFLGLGLVIAMLADNVPAVQALGQCIFLPMLIIGGVAVPLTSLPDWALHVSAYFPGRYAVEAIQAAVNGPGLSAEGFSLIALTLIGSAACVAGAGMFRWDARQRFAASHGKGWIAVALAGWVGVGLLAQAQGRVIPPELARERQTSAESIASTAPERNAVTAIEQDTGVSEVPSETTATQVAPPDTPAAPSPPPPAPSPVPAPPEKPAEPDVPAPPPPIPARAPWEQVTLEQIMEDIVFHRLPPDAGVVTPIASLDREPDPEIAEALDVMYIGLQVWRPGQVPNVLDRVRNLLFVPAVVDVFQMPMEPFVPLLIFDHLEQTIDRDVLLKALYWIAVHPDEGSDAAVDELRPLGLTNGPNDMDEVRGRVGVYAVKLIGRLTGARPAQ